MKKYQNKFVKSCLKPREYFSVAPMVDFTDKYFRFLARKLTKHSWLYTEMINENVVINSITKNKKLNPLSLTPNQHPVVF